MAQLSDADNLEAGVIASRPRAADGPVTPAAPTPIDDVQFQQVFTDAAKQAANTTSPTPKGYPDSGYLP